MYYEYNKEYFIDVYKAVNNTDPFQYVTTIKLPMRMLSFMAGINYTIGIGIDSEYQKQFYKIEL